MKVRGGIDWEEKHSRPLPLPLAHVFNLCCTHLPRSHRNSLLTYCSWSRTNHSTLPVAWEVTPEPGLVAAAAAADTLSQSKWRMGGWVLLSEGRQRRVTRVRSWFLHVASCLGKTSLLQHTVYLHCKHCTGQHHCHYWCNINITDTCTCGKHMRDHIENIHINMYYDEMCCAVMHYIKQSPSNV